MTLCPLTPLPYPPPRGGLLLCSVLLSLLWPSCVQAQRGSPLGLLGFFLNSAKRKYAPLAEESWVASPQEALPPTPHRELDPLPPPVPLQEGVDRLLGAWSYDCLAPATWTRTAQLAPQLEKLWQESAPYPRLAACLRPLLSDLGSYYHRVEGAYNKALPYLWEALEQAYASGSPAEVICLSEKISQAYLGQGDYPTALRLCLATWKRCRAKLGKRDPDTALACQNVGFVYAAQGAYQEALHYSTKALSIQRKALRGWADHPDTGLIFHGIGLAYKGLGKHDRAERSFLKALAIKRRALGHQHPALVATYIDLGQLYTASQEAESPAKALACLHEALAIGQAHLVPSHPLFIRIYTALARCYTAQGHELFAQRCQAWVDCLKAEQG